MNKETIIKEINDFLQSEDVSEQDMFTDNKWDTLDNILYIVNNIDVWIDLDLIDHESDSRCQVTTYIKTDWHKWYSVIIDSSFEKYRINSIDELADVILEYLEEISHLQITYK